MKAKLLNQSGKVYIFEVDEPLKIPDGEIDLTVKKLSKKRTLDANAYMWVLLGKQASVRNRNHMTVTNWDCYLESLKKYGQFTYLILKPKACEMFKKTWRECEEVGEIAINGEKAIQLLCFFGSSNYDTAEFSALLNGIIEDCKDLGIETATPDEVAHMMELYRRKDEKTNNSTSI